MDVTNHAAAAGGNNGFQGEPTSATHATVYATAYSDVSRVDGLYRWISQITYRKWSGLMKPFQLGRLDSRI